MLEEEKIECQHEETYAIPRQNGYQTRCVACDEIVEVRKSVFAIDE
jgi:hypothetical protein